ncbi:hypothetical protein Lrub_1922 [Legionella rubrilucens]|uniref:Acyl-coenzyme A:6-aminopenicillanic acid acyl-transferase n=1 Tax=Legionella rubrilucens TaxID=458 RepID=A0A0W0XQX0_9GAMM|nr:hypothetical protein [Legionella rubrilucens]KTD47000.1 hypothetical protein Lrub_1922 [Legionella rubrilucens]
MKRILISWLCLMPCLNLYGQTTVQRLELHGSFYDMGIQYAEKTADKLIAQKALSIQSLYPDDPVKKRKFERLVKMWLKQARLRYPPELYEFIQGEANSDFAKTHGLTIDDFIFLDQSIILTLFAKEFKNGPSVDSCSFLALTDKAVMAGRNFDYPRDYLAMTTRYPQVILFEHQDNDRYPHRVMSIGQPGLISAATFMNDQGYFMAINAGASVGNEYKVFQRRTYFGQMLIQMFKTSQFDQLSNWVRHTAPDFGYLVNIAGPKENDLLSFEASPYNEVQGHYPLDQLPEDVFKIRSRKPGEAETVEPELDNNRDFLVAANTFRLLNWPLYLGHDHGQQTPSFSAERYLHLTELARARQNSSVETLKGIMEKELNTLQAVPGATVHYCGTDPHYQSDPSVTYYTVVFDTARREAFIRFQQTENDQEAPCASQWTPWQSVAF